MRRMTILATVLLGMVLFAHEARAEEPLLDPAKAAFTGAKATEGGPAFHFDLGTKRGNWTKAAWSQHAFDKTRDLSKHMGLRISVTTDKPREDASVAIALREADGSWHYMAHAVDLVKAENARVIRLRDFRPAYWLAPHTHGVPQDHYDQNNALDPEAIDTIAIGVCNSLGIGEVSFTVTGIELVEEMAGKTGTEQSGGSAKPRAALITVTGKTLDVNGTTTIPAGLFGNFASSVPDSMRVGSHREIHHSYLSRGDDGQIRAKRQASEKSYAVLIDVQGGDRYSASGRLGMRNWQRYYRNSGLSRGRMLKDYAKKYDREMVIEWWNEPYLNWSNRTRKNFDLDFFDVTRAREGGVVHLRKDGSVAPYLRWTKDYDAPPWNWTTRERWRAGKDKDGRVMRGAHPPEDVKDGQTWMHSVYDTKRDPETRKKIRVKKGEVELTAFTPWYVYDVTQFTYWSGQGQLRHYNEPMLAFARGLHETNPEAKFLAGWDFRPSEDHWAGFHMMYKPTIDAGIEHIYGVTDHDYGGDVTRMPANYEVIAAYGMTYHNKWLYSYNTECGENSDPSAIPAASKSMQSADKKWLKCMWASRKIVHALATVPGKARSFTFHWFDTGGEGVAFNAMKNLRGKLVQADCSDPDIFVAASIDGTDPYIPRQPYLPEGKELVIAIFNDHREARKVDVPITAPTGTQIEQLIVRSTAPEPGKGTVRLDEQRLKASGDSARWQGEVAGKSLVVLTLPLKGEVVKHAQVTRKQYFADEVLKWVRPGKPLDWQIDIPAEALQGAKRARLRFVFEQLAEGEGTLDLGTTERDHRGRRQPKMNEKPMTLPRCPTPINVAWIRDVEIDPSMLTDDNVLRFAASEGHAGYLVCMASVIVEK